MQNKKTNFHYRNKESFSLGPFFSRFGNNATLTDEELKTKWPKKVILKKKNKTKTSYLDDM